MKKPKAKAKRSPAQKKDMTVSELAGMVARGFTEVHERFKTVSAGLDRVDERLDAVETKLIIMEEKIDRVHGSVHELSYDYRKMKTRVEHIELKVFGSIQEP